MTIASAKIFKSLTRILGNTGCVLNREQKSNLIYAFTRIVPQRINELSVTVVFGLQTNSAHEIVDAYIDRRKRAGQVFFPYESVKGLNEVLANTFGILLYKEQASLLINELIQNTDDDAFSFDFVNRDKFMESLKAEYKHKLSEREKNAIYLGLLTYSAIKMNSYDWCRNIAESIKREAEGNKS